MELINTRIDHRLLSTLCERVGIAFEVGLDPYRVFERESESRRFHYSKRMRSVAKHVRGGESLSEAIRAQGNYFPDHFADMIEGGEATGRLDRVLDRSADYYAQSAEYRAAFKSSILWPLLQLVLAVVVIGGLIYLPEAIVAGEENDASRDLLGLGLVGWAGLKTYMIYVAVTSAIVFAFVWLVRNGYLGFLADIAARIPVVGGMVRVFPEARFVQTFSLGVDAGLNATSAATLAFQSAGTPMYERQALPVNKRLLAGGE
ncbi:MAG: type II secretion system F family protein, partial [Planctomycetota bacterium]